MILKKLHLNLSISGQALICSWFCCIHLIAVLLADIPESVTGQDAHRKSCRTYEERDVVVDHRNVKLVMLKLENSW